MKKIALFISVLLISTCIIADEIDADAYIDYRENLMENAKNHTKGIAAILKGKVNAKDNLIHHARALQEVAMMIPTAFPEGSDFGDTRAKEKIWEDWDSFMKASKRNQQAVTALVKAAESGDMKSIGSAMEDVGKSCKGCHKEYRSKE